MEPIDPKDWCSLNWDNSKNLNQSVCKLRSQEFNQSKKPWEEDQGPDYKNAYSRIKQTLTLEFERPFNVSAINANSTQIVLDQAYDIKVFYSKFQHDGIEDKNKLLGGKDLSLKLSKD